MSPVLLDRMQQVMQLHLQNGSHDDFESGMCVIEAVAYVAGEPWSDHPPCVCPVIGAFMRSWNDGLPSDADRDRLLKPLIPRLIDTRSTKAVEEKRSYLALDWLIRVYTPKWLDLVPYLAPHAVALRNLADIADMAGALAAGEAVLAAGASARAAAAGDAAAGDAAWDAARAAAAGDAAAWDAARAAARAAAAWGDLKPTVEWLQASALGLVDKMIDVTP